MWKVLICCTNAVATSTFVAVKIKKKLEVVGLKVETKTCSVLEIERQIKSFRPDLIVSNVGKAAKIETDVPIIDGIAILSGKGDEEAWDKIISYLKEKEA